MGWEMVRGGPGMASQVRIPRFECWLCCLPAGWLWASGDHQTLPRRTAGGLHEMESVKALKRHIAVFQFECQLQGCCMGQNCGIGGLEGKR